MRSLKIRMLAACFIALAATPAAWAQWAVVDAPAIVQLIQEVQTTAQQLQTARAQLLQAASIRTLRIRIGTPFHSVCSARNCGSQAFGSVPLAAMMRCMRCT